MGNEWGKSAASYLMQINAGGAGPKRRGFFVCPADDLRQSAGQRSAPWSLAMWQPIATAPFDSDLELAVIDENGPHALVFPCRRILGGWIKAATRQRLEVHPTHWRKWEGEGKAA